jgi:hypothetical protein
MLVLEAQCSSPHRRPYHWRQERIEWYRRRQEQGDIIDTKALVQAGLSSNLQSARKMANRDCLAGILKPTRTWPRCYQVLGENTGRKNVTLPCAASSRGPTRASTAPRRPRIHAQEGPSRATFTHNDCHSSLLLPNQGTLVCYTDPRTDRDDDGEEEEEEVIDQELQYLRSNARRRVRGYRHRLRQKLLLQATRLAIAQDLSARLEKAQSARCFFRTHNLCFQLFIEDPDAAWLAALYSSSSRRFLWVNGVKVNFRVYERSGLCLVQPQCSVEAVCVDGLPQFMADIKRALPFQTPEIEKWKITCADVHPPDRELSSQDLNKESWIKTLEKCPLIQDLDGPIMSGTLHVYVKKTYGGNKKRIRSELWREQPNCTIDQFMDSYIEEEVLYKFWAAIEASSRISPHSLHR